MRSKLLGLLILGYTFGSYAGPNSYCELVNMRLWQEFQAKLQPISARMNSEASELAHDEIAGPQFENLRKGQPDYSMIANSKKNNRSITWLFVDLKSDDPKIELSTSGLDVRSPNLSSDVMSLKQFVGEKYDASQKISMIRKISYDQDIEQKSTPTLKFIDFGYWDENGMERQERYTINEFFNNLILPAECKDKVASHPEINDDSARNNQKEISAGSFQSRQFEKRGALNQ